MGFRLFQEYGLTKSIANRSKSRAAIYGISEILGVLAYFQQAYRPRSRHNSDPRAGEAGQDGKQGFEGGRHLVAL